MELTENQSLIINNFILESKTAHLTKELGMAKTEIRKKDDKNTKPINEMETTNTTSLRITFGLHFIVAF